MKQSLKALNTGVHRLMLLVADAALLGMVVIVTFTVFMRYIFNTGIGWAEEVPRLLVTLFAFLAMAMGVRDHLHIGVNIVYNLFPKRGAARRFMVWFSDFCVLLCGCFMLYYGAVYCLRIAKLPGSLPMTGLDTWWQYLPIPLTGFVISFDSLLFLTGVLERDDFLYSDPDVDYREIALEQEGKKEETA